MQIIYFDLGEYCRYWQRQRKRERERWGCVEKGGIIKTCNSQIQGRQSRGDTTPPPPTRWGHHIKCPLLFCQKSRGTHFAHTTPPPLRCRRLNPPLCNCVCPPHDQARIDALGQITSSMRGTHGTKNRNARERATKPESESARGADCWYIAATLEQLALMKYSSQSLSSRPKFGGGLCLVCKHRL